MALKAGNGKYVCTKKNGQLSAVSDAVGKWPAIRNCMFSTEALLPSAGSHRVGAGGFGVVSVPFPSQVMTSYS